MTYATTSIKLKRVEVHKGLYAVSDIIEYVVPNDLCKFTTFDNLDTASSAANDTEQCEGQSNFCTYTPFDKIDTPSALISDPTPMQCCMKKSYEN